MTSLDGFLSQTVKGGSTRGPCGTGGGSLGITEGLSCTCPPVTDSINDPDCATNTVNTNTSAGTNATCPGAG